MALTLMKNLPLTNYKLLIARFLYKFIRIFFERHRIVDRGGIHFSIDLTEGIDLSIFLFGFFQKKVLKNQFYQIKKGEVIFDVGANIGFLTLSFAKSVGPSGRVFAFEPTDYAFAKLEKNIALNRDFGSRITRVKCFLSSKCEAQSDLSAYSSWKVDASIDNKTRHPVHGGAIMAAASTPSYTLDAFVNENSIDRIDLIKIDTDGHEFNVIQGGKSIIVKLRPKIVFECGQYILKERGHSLHELIAFFASLNYRVFDIYSGQQISIQNAHKAIPVNSTTDLIAIPENGQTT